MFDPLFDALEALHMSASIRESEWLFPTIETVHVLALTMVVGSIAMVDLRLLGVRYRNRSVADLAIETLPWTWTSFAIAVMSGALMFTAKAMTYGHNLPFQIKMIVLVLAGLNMAFFHTSTYRSVHEWGLRPVPPRAARIAGALSLAFWIIVVALGRWVGFV